MAAVVMVAADTALTADAVVEVVDSGDELARAAATPVSRSAGATVSEGQAGGGSSNGAAKAQQNTCAGGSGQTGSAATEVGTGRGSGMDGGRRARPGAAGGRGQKRTAADASCGSTQKQQRAATRQDVLGWKVHAVLCAVRAGEQRTRERKRSREQQEAESPTLSMTAHSIAGRTLNAPNHVPCSGEEVNQRRPKTPRIAYYTEYPERSVPATEEGLWDGRPKRSRRPEGAYDPVVRRGPRREVQKRTRRQKVSIVPIGRRLIRK